MTQQTNYNLPAMPLGQVDFNSTAWQMWFSSLRDIVGTVSTSTQAYTPQVSGISGYTKMSANYNTSGSTVHVWVTFTTGGTLIIANGATVGIPKPAAAQSTMSVSGTSSVGQIAPKASAASFPAITVSASSVTLYAVYSM